MSVPYTKQLAYIESTGTQYIDTGFKPNQDTRVICSFEQITTRSIAAPFGCESPRYSAYIISSKFRFDYNSTMTPTQVQVENNVLHEIDFNKNNVYLDGTLNTTFTYGNFTAPNLLLFRTTYGGSNFYGRIYWCKVYDNDVLVRDFIPVRIGNEGCLYDNVSGELFRNKGTGNFIFNEILEHSPLTSNIRRRLLYAKPKEDYSMYAVHKKVNPEVMAVCYAQGWAANENYMTFEEAAAVTDIGTAFQHKRFEYFDEFQYFTGIQSIPNFAFRDCEIVSITLPEQIVSIGQGAFYWSKIKIFRIPKNVIPSAASNILFRNEVLEKIIWDSNIPPIYSFIDVGYYKPNFTEITSNNPLYHCQNGCIWSVDKTKLYMVPEGAFSRFSFIGTERYIADTFFHVVAGSITIPSHISDFKTYRKDVNFRASEITELDMSACNVGDKIPNFRDGYITTIKMPQCTTIGGFGNFMSVTITNMILNQSTVPTMTHRQCFYPSPPTNIYVPDSAVNDYKAANNWVNYADNIKPLSEYNQS